MFNIGPGEMIMLAVLALLIFGPARLPEMGRALGQGLRAFRQAANSLKDEIRNLDVDASPGGVVRREPELRGSDALAAPDGAQAMEAPQGDVAVEPDAPEAAASVDESSPPDESARSPCP